MPSQDKLIKNGIKYTDSLFDEIISRLEKGVKSSDTLEAFLEATKDYTTNNPLVTSGYDKKMLELILQETNNHKFSRPAQKELVRVTVENNVGDLIQDVGDDVKESVREIVKEGYNQNLSQDEIANNISNKVTSIKNRRARAIARTEIARTATVSDYIINKERGATHWYAECRNTACPVCKERWHKYWSKDNDETFNPKETSAGGKGWIGDNVYSMNDTSMLPPVHPNCRCVVYFINENDGKPTTKNPTPEELPLPTPGQLKKNLRPGEREKYNSYHRNIVLQREWLKENPNAPAEEIAKHQKRLKFLQGKFEELRRKALGDGNGNATPNPKATPKPKPKPKAEPKPKPTPKPKAKKPKASAKPKEEKPKTKSAIKESLEDLKKKILTKEEVDKLTFNELADHYNVEYNGVEVYDYDNKKYHVFKQKYSNGRELTVYFEEGAVNSYNKKGIASANEILQEVFKVPEALRNETNAIWFKNTQQGIHHRATKSGYDSLGNNVGGYNTCKYFPNDKGDYDHNIVINPKYFKGGGKGRHAYIWAKDPENARGWKMTIFHEFTHSGDKSIAVGLSNDKRSLSVRPDYRAIQKEEPYFTWYADTKISESYAEHGGYIGYMEMNPSEQHKKIQVTYKDKETGNVMRKSINYEEYKQLYPKHYEYFMKKFEEGF